MVDEKPNGHRVTATDRAVRALSAFSLQSEWGVRELANHLGVSKSGLHRTLQELADAGMLSADPYGTYSTAPGLMELAANVIRSTDLIRVAHKHLERSRDLGGETTVLVAYDRDRHQIIAVDAAESAQPIQFAWRVLRDWTDLHVASGRGLLPYLDPQDIDRLLAQPLLDVDGSAIDVEELRAEIAATRTRGYAIIPGHRAPGSTAVSSPVLGPNQRLVGGVVIAWPTRAANERVIARLGELCARTAADITRELGGMPGPSSVPTETPEPGSRGRPRPRRSNGSAAWRVGQH